MTQQPAPWLPPDGAPAQPAPVAAPVAAPGSAPAPPAPAYAAPAQPAQAWPPHAYAPPPVWPPYGYAAPPPHGYAVPPPPPGYGYPPYPYPFPPAPYGGYAPGWGPPPGWAPPGRRSHALDEQVRAGLAVPGGWGLAATLQVLVPLGAMVVVVLLVGLLQLPTGPDAGAFYGVTAGLLGGLAVYLSARGLARRHGGWEAAFGFHLPRLRDLPSALGWFGIQVGARFSLAIGLALLSPSLADSHGGNVEGAVEGVTAAGVVFTLVAAVVIAPVMEELAFRGVLLRGLMRRMSFWPSALLSSVLFTVLHIPGAASAAAIPLLVTMIMLFAVLQCLLVRRTGRLGPAIAVHAAMNGLVMAFAFA